jgi:hypothetical protein
MRQALIPSSEEAKGHEDIGHYCGIAQPVPIFFEACQFVVGGYYLDRKT